MTTLTPRAKTWIDAARDRAMAHIMCRVRMTKQFGDIGLDEIAVIAGRAFGVDDLDVRARSQFWIDAAARHTALALAYFLTDVSTPNIARYFGLQHHGDVVGAAKRLSQVKDVLGDAAVRRSLRTKKQQRRRIAYAGSRRLEAVT